MMETAAELDSGEKCVIAYTESLEGMRDIAIEGLRKLIGLYTKQFGITHNKAARNASCFSLKRRSKYFLCVFRGLFFYIFKRYVFYF